MVIEVFVFLWWLWSNCCLLGVPARHALILGSLAPCSTYCAICILLCLHLYPQTCTDIFKNLCHCIYTCINEIYGSRRNLPTTLAKHPLEKQLAVMAAVCPICFEDDGQPVVYATMHNHSWQNRHCDAHGICWKCLNRYVEMQILEEGRFNLKCPGIGCNYRLLPLDVERALEASEPERQQVALERYGSMRSASHEERLREVALGTSGPSECWLLQECQACPRCLSLVRRETGCLHVFCRCGCDFCAGCGSPDECLCAALDKDRDVVFAAWLRISPDSPVAWLREMPSSDMSEERLLGTLGFFLWMAYLPVDLPWTRALEEPEHSLPPLRWRYYHSNSDFSWFVMTEEEAFNRERFPEVFRQPLSSWWNGVDGDESENWFQHYRRVPRRPWRLFATQRGSRRQDRHHYTPLRWKDVRAWTGDDAAVPLRRRRQPRAVATAARSAEPTAAAARKVQEQRKRRQQMRSRFREELVQLEFR